MAAQHLGLDCVPVDFQHYTCYDAELADLLADNKIAELAEIDSKMLAEVFQNIDPDAIDLDITGYSEEEYNDIIKALMDATNTSPRRIRNRRACGGTGADSLRPGGCLASGQTPSSVRRQHQCGSCGCPYGRDKG
jgi:hypothetical protein